MRQSKRAGRLVLDHDPQFGIPALYLHDLTGTPEVDRLLSKTPLVHPGTSDVLPRLRRWMPGLASQLSAKDSRALIPFRLITTNPDWIDGEVNAFTAISYCWHNAGWELPPRLYFESWKFPISPAMLKASYLFQSLQSHGSSHVAMWIDQICINQQDATEQFNAISSMDTIYRNATTISILLEDFDITLEEESAYGLRSRVLMNSRISHIDCSYVKDHFMTSDLYDDALMSMQSKLMNSRWFTRAWCRHEYMLNPKASFIVVGKKLDCIAIDASSVDAFASGCTGIRDGLSGIVSRAIQDYIVGANSRKSDLYTEKPLWQIFVQLEPLKCSFAEDIVSIALNASGIRLSFRGELARSQCRFVLASIALSAGDASVLGTGGLPMQASTRTNRFDPHDWAKEYASSWSLLSMCRMSKVGEDTKIWAISPYSISLDLFNFTALPSKPQPDRPEAVFRLPEVLDADWAGFRDLLNCIFSCGLRWLNMVTDAMKDFSLLEDMPHEDAHFEATKASLLHYCQESGSPLEIHQNVPRMAQILINLSRRLKFFVHTKEDTALLMRLSSTASANAIALVPQVFAEPVCNGRYSLAIPQALNTMDALTVNRLWIMNSAASGGVTTIVGRGYILMPSSLDVDRHDNIRYAERITVTGDKYGIPPDQGITNTKT